MNRFFTTFFLLMLACMFACAQVPEKMTYQAVVREVNNSLVANRNVSARIWILQGSADGAAVYVETQSATTNANGMMTLVLGDGTAVSGSLSAINWASGPYFLKAEIDPAGGGSYTLQTVQELLSVPYSLYAKEAGNVFSGDYNDLTNTPTIPTVPENVSAFTNDAGYLTPATVQDAVTIPTNVSTFTNDAGYITPAQVPAQVNADWNATDGAAEILNKPTIPAAANDATLTLQQNGTAIGTFTADASSDTTLNVTVPTATDQLVNDIGYLTLDSFPMNVSTFTNDAGYLTAAQCGDTSLCEMANMITSLQNQIGQLQTAIGQLAVELDSLEEARFICGTSTVKDFDNNVYNTVQIGNQCWMRENLRTTHYSDGTEITASTMMFIDQMVRYIPNNDINLVPTYGYLYNWAAVMHNTASSSGNPSGVQGICPEGWHVPSKAEWNQLSDFVSSQIQYVCGNDNTNITKAMASTTGWDTSDVLCAVGNNPSMNNATGFTAVPAGGYFLNPNNFGTTASFWSAEQSGDGYSWLFQLSNVSGTVFQTTYHKKYGLSVRCLRDALGLSGGLPTVTTGSVSDITPTSATCGGNITSDGNAVVTVRGVCWSTSQNPTLADSHTTDSTGTGVFTSSLTDLTPGMHYYVRAYATNSAGTVYGEQITFTTLTLSLPTVMTSAATEIAVTTAVCGGEVTADGNAEVTARGVCWGTSENPTLADSHTVDGSGLGSFTSSLTGLTTGTYYYVRAYATNSVGTSYGSCQSFRTTVVSLPNVLTYAVDNITTTTAQCGGFVYAGAGDLPVTARGVCWNTTGDPTLADSHTVDGSGTESFTSELTNLTPNTTYYVRAYATNSVGTNYGESRHFTTMALSLLSVTTDSVRDITYTTAICVGNVTSEGDAPVTARGVCWSTSQNPTLADNHTTDGAGTGSFTSSLTDLNPYTYYYVRAYATSSVGTVYGENKMFRTKALTKPTVTTDSVSNITRNSAVCGGEVTDDGGSEVTVRGVCWSTSPNPTLADSYSTDGSGTGSFTSSLTDLTPNTRYYVRAYATNNVGTSYGNTCWFRTPVLSLPTVTTDTISNITYTTATCGGEVTSEGDAPVTERGVCWGSDWNPTVDGDHIAVGSGMGAFTTTLTNLSPDTRYYVRAYAISSAGIVYGNWMSFRTNNYTRPTVVTDTVSDITHTTAICGGEVTCENGLPVTARGVCWSDLTSTPSLANSYTMDGSGMGAFTSNLTELTPNTLYYVRAYATNSAGTGYGNTYSFRTPVLNLPTVTTASVSDITYTTVICGGEVTSEGDAPVTARGVCWCLYGPVPTVDSSHTVDGSGLGSFTSVITGLAPNTQYWLRAYATNRLGTNYGVLTPFTTNALGYPMLSTDSVRDITHTTATCGGEVTSDGGSPVTARGVCWNTTGNPTLADSHTTDGSGTGVFTSNLTDLTPNTGYYVRAYATNSTGTSYGNPYWFRTPALSLPTVVTDSITDITYTTATCGGEVTSEGDAPVTERGVCWGSDWNLTVDGDHIAIGSGMGAFTTTLTNLSPDTRYYVRAYAISSAGVVYGNWMSFRTNNYTKPTVITDTVSDITHTTAICGGEVTSENGLPVTARGVCWSEVSSTPSLADAHSIDGSGMGVFTSNLTELTPNTLYYVRAYATNSAGTGYGNTYSFRTPVLNLPTVTTASVSDITYTTVICGGEVTSEGDAPVTARGVCWCLYGPVPTVDSSHTEDGSGLGSFTSVITGLAPNTQYWLRAYATNRLGTNYGVLTPFTTNALGYPMLSTDSVRDITYTTATCGGEVTSDGGSPVTARGVCWNTIGNPTLADSYTTDGSGTGVFTSNLTDLTPNTGYYVRAYATNSAGTSYGNPYWFRTPALSLPTVVTDSITDITYTTATCGGEVTSEGDAPVTERGVCWGSDWNLTVDGDHIAIGSGMGAFTTTLTNLSPDTRYYVRAYAISSAGIVYGNWMSFKTNNYTRPTVVTDTVSDITYATATCGGEVTSDGGLPVTARGVCWNTLGGPTIADSHTTDGSGTGVFTSNLTELTPNTHYYVRAYATNSAGTTYGNTYWFRTPVLNLPTVTTASISEITYTTVTCGGEVTSEGDTPVTDRGVCWCLYGSVPTVDSSHTVDGFGLGSFTSVITGLAPNTQYCLRAYATNSLGTAYGVLTPFTTNALGYPILSTDSVRDITYTTATCGGEVTSDGGSSVTARGVCWNTTGNPTLADSHTTDGSGTGSFTSSLTDLTPNTGYYVRAYATNSEGTRYGNTYWFRTLAYSLPTVTTDTVSNITYTTATCGGNVTSDGGYPVTARGVCWNTLGGPTIADSHTTDGTGTGVFTSSLTGLALGTVYYCRTYATNALGTSYGNTYWFKTDEYKKPTVELTYVGDITGTSVVCSGNVTDEGDAPVTVRGFQWMTPSGTNYHTITVGEGAGSFTDTITGLQPGSIYYVWAFAINSIGTTNSTAQIVTTVALPVVTTDTISNISYTTATCGGNVTDEGGAPVIACGICWSKTAPPTVDSSHTVDGSGTGSFTSNMTGLEPHTRYWVRAYATTSAGTAYGQMVMFYTDHLKKPTITTYEISDISYTTATCGGEVTDDGGSTVTARGVCWCAGYSFPSVDSSHTVDGADTGSFTSYITGLTPNTHYYLRAYATNSVGTSYGEVRGFQTAEMFRPILVTHPVTNINQTTATFNGEIIDEGTTPVMARGFCWGTSPSDLTLDGPHTNEGPGTGTFSSSITGLSLATTYYVRAYATNSAGTSYATGGIQVFTTLGLFPPTVTTGWPYVIDLTTAVCTGEVTSEGDAPVTARGICWNNANLHTFPRVTDNHTNEGSGLGAFSSTLTNLVPGNTYYLRAYACSSVDTVYGELRELFVPVDDLQGLPCPGTPTVTDVDNNTYNTVWVGTQCWMKENLRTTHFADNTPIAYGGGNVSLTTPYRYYPNNNSNLVSTYGYLYNMSATRRGSSSSNATPSGVQGICPDGWHVPSNSEWWLMINYLTDHNEQYACVEEVHNPDWEVNNSNYVGKALASTTGWPAYDPDFSTCSPSYNPSSNNLTNFTALPAGYRNHTEGTTNNHYSSFGSKARIWSCSHSSSNASYAFDIDAYYPEAWTYGLDNRSALPVRCVRD